MSQLPCPRSDHIGSICELLELCLENVAGANFFLFILPDRQGWNKLLASATIDEEEVLFADLHAQLFLRIVELTNSSSFGESAESELSGMRAGEFNDFQPCDVVGGVFGVAGSTFVVRCYDFGRRIKAALKALDQDRTKRPCAEIGSQRLMAIEDACVGRQQREQVRQSVVLVDQR